MEALSLTPKIEANTDRIKEVKLNTDKAIFEGFKGFVSSM